MGGLSLRTPFPAGWPGGYPALSRPLPCLCRFSLYALLCSSTLCGSLAPKKAGRMGPSPPLLSLVPPWE